MLSSNTTTRAAIVGSKLLSPFRSAVASSRIATGLRRTFAESATIPERRPFARKVQGWFLKSHIWAVTQPIQPSFDHWLDRSLLTQLIAYSFDAYTTSWIYQWLTKEPDPEVIVIDIRYTRSVGPFLAVVDELLAFLLPATGYSLLVRTGSRTLKAFLDTPIRVASYGIMGATVAGTAFGFLIGAMNIPTTLIAILLVVLAAVGTHVRMGWEEIVESPVVKFLVRLFAPPEPPTPPGFPEPGKHEWETNNPPGDSADARDPNRESSDKDQTTKDVPADNQNG